MFVCDMDSPDEARLHACGQLCEALLAHGTQALLLRAWGRHDTHKAPLRAAKIREQPYPVYCAQDVRAAAPLLALLEQATVAIALGENPPATAQTLLDAGIPCLAWFLDQASLHAIPAGKMDPRLALVAAPTALATQITLMTGLPVAALLPPCAPSSAHASAESGTILVPGSKRKDGISHVVEMARLRPQYRFAVLTGSAPECVLQAAALALPPNVSPISGEKRLPPARLALLPALDGNLPWNTLGECLSAGIPVLGSTEALLVDALGAAGSTLPASAPLASWLKELDSLMREEANGEKNAKYAGLANETQRQGALLRPLPDQAAHQCLELIHRHLHTGAQRLTGRL